MPEQNQTPRVPLTVEELDLADSGQTGRPTLAMQLGWTKEDYAAFNAAIDEVLPDQSWQEPNDAIKRMLDCVDRPAAKQGQLTKAVREGKTTAVLYEQLKRVRNLYRDNGWTVTQIRNYTANEFAVIWEWVDRLPEDRKKAFLDVCDWDDGDKYIYLQISTLYRYSGHLRRQPSWRTVRDWRIAFRGYEKYGTNDGRPHKR